MGDKSAGEGQPPPSPLTGAYLLIVLPQTHQQQHKDNVIHNLTKGLLTWDKNDCHVDLEKELQTIAGQAPDGEEAKNGERLIQFASENLVTEVLIHPQLNTLVQCMRNLLSSFTRHRHIIHAGYTCTGNGAWLLQDGTYSYADFAEMYQEHEVQRVLRAYENTVTVDFHCLQEGDWNNLKGKDPFSKNSRVRLNPKDCMTSSPALKGFLDFLAPYVSNGSIEELLESSDVVGNIRFSHPTLYVFPGGQGDAALFGINGFNMLVDGGFARKACFWDFSRHLDRLDAVLMTRLNNGNVQGMTSLLQRKRMENVYPQIGHFFCNLQERKHPLSPDGDKDKDPLLVSLFDQGHDILGSLRHLQLKPQPCYRDPMLEPVNLYHKVGHGKLDMYVISPAKDSREVREFMAKWTTQDSKIFCSFTKRGGEFQLPLCNKVSICALLVWQPANPEDNITRLLFPGSTPQNKIFEGLDRLKNLEFMKHPVCSARTLSPSPSSVGLNIRTISKPKVPASVDKIIENEDKKIEAVKQPIMKPPSGQVEKPQPKPTPPVSRAPSKQKPAEKPKEKPKTEVEVKSEKPETAKTEKAKPEKIEKTEAVQKIEKPKEKPKRPITKQPERKKPPQPVGGEKKDSLKSSPTTPKKIAENKITESKISDTKTEAPPKPEVKSRASSRTKPSPSATPAKSAKEANNRKVLEQKKEATKRVPLAKKDDSKKPEKPAASRKSAPSPSRADKQQLSPVKAPRPVTRPKQDAKKPIKTEKDALPESVVSTPSTVDVELAKAKEDLAEKETKVEDAKVEEVAEAAELPSFSRDEEDEILVVEKIEIEGDDKDKPEESIAVHIRKSREDIADGEEIKEGVAADQQSDEKKELMKTSDITIPDTDSKHLSEDVQDLTKDAPDTSKSRVELLATEEASLTKEPVTDKLTPKEKDAKEKSTDVGDVKQTDESQPDEKFSTTVESGATTAPTLPEDERIPLDEIKEQIEEKHVKEETKEKEVGAAPRPEQPTSLPQVPVIHGMPFDQRVHLLKDIVKTPDEVADLPMHEEADGGIYGVDNGGPLCKELHKTKDDLLNIPAKKPTEKKEDEEVKLVKDENEKEDATKDLKEDDAPLEDKAAPSIIADAKEEALGEKESKPEKEADHKPLDTLAKQDSGLEQDIDDEEIKELEHIDNELTKSSAVPPVSQEEDEVLDEDKDKETEKEKLLRKETEKDVEEIEEKADKEKPVGKEETANVEVKEKEGVEEKEPITTGSSQEGEKEVVDSAVDRKASIEGGKSPQAINEEKQIDDANGISEESKGKDEIVVTAVIESPEPQADENKLSMSPSPQPETAAAKSPEPQKLSKSPSPEPTAAIAKSPEPEKLLKSPSPVPVDTTKVDQEKSAKSPSPEPQIEAVEVEQDAKAPSPVLEAQPSGEEKSSELAPETQKSPSPGNVYELVESPGPSGKISEAAEDSVQVNVPLKSSKSPSPQPTADPSKDESSEIKSPSPEPQVKSPEPEAKSPSPKPMKDSDKSPEKAKSPSPEPQLDLGKSLEPSTKPSKSPSPEPQNDAAKPASPDKGKSPEPEVKLSESPSSDPKEVEEIAELEAKISKTPTPEPLDEVAKSPEPAAKISKPASPEPQADAKISKSPVSGATPEEAKSQELTPKLSKSPSPEPKASEGKELETTDKPECTEPKSDEAEPIVVDTGNLISSQSVTDHAGSPEPATKLLQSPSPEPSVDLLVKSPEPETKGSKSTELLTEISKSPEQTAQVSKSPSPELEDDKSKVTELIATLTSADAKVAMTQEAKTKSPSPEPDAGIDSGKAESKASKSPSPEPTVIVAQFLGTEIEVSKLALTEPIEEAAMSLEPEEQVSKAPSPDCKGVLTKSPEPTAKDAPSPSPGPEGIVTVESKEGQWESTADVPASLEAEIKASKSPSPELIAEVAKSLEPEEKPPSPDTKVLLTKSPEPTAKDAPSPSTGPEGIVTVESKEGQQESTADVPASLEAEIKASKSPSPEPIAEVAKSLEPEEKLPSPDTKVVLTKLPEPTAKDAPSPSPGSEGVLTVESKEGQQESATDVPVSLEAEIRASKSPTPEPIAEVAKSLESEEKLPSPDTKVVLTKSPEPTAEDAPSPSPGQEGILTVESKERQQESTTDVLASLEAEKKASKSSSPEPIAEVAKYLDPEEKPPSPDSKEVLTKSPEPTARDVPSPSPGLEEILTVESKECQQESTPNVPASLDAEKKVSKSPEPIAEVAKSLDIETKASKTPSPELTAQPAKLLDADIQASSTQPTSDEAKSADSEMKASKSPSPEPTVEKAKPLAAEIAVSKSPSPEPKPETASTLETEIRSSQSQSPETTADTAKVWKEPTGEPTGELAKSLEAELKASKSPSPEPIAETAKSLDVIAKASKSPSPELIAETTQSLEAEIKTSKSPSPEPETETAKPLEAEIKASKSSPEPTTDTAMSLHAKVDASKSPSPEPTVELEKSLEVDIKASKSPSPEPTVEIATSSETKVSKSPSPEPTTEAAKSPDADIKTSKSPSPEPAESRKSQETDVKTSTSLSLEPQDVTKSASEQETKATESTAKSPSPEPLIEVGKTSPSPLISDPEESKLPELAKDSKSPSPPPSSKVPELETKAGISKSPSPEPTKEIDISHKKDAKIESKEDPSDEKKTSEFAIKKEGKDVSDSKPDQAGSCEPKDDDGMVDTVESLKQDVTEESELVGRVQIDHEFDDLAGEMLKKDDKVPSLSLREASLEQHSEEGSVPKPEDKGPKDESTAVRKQSSGEVSTKSQEAEDKDVIPPSTSPVGSDRSEARRSGEISPLPKDSKSPSPEPSPKPVVETVEGADTVSGNISPLNDVSLKDREEPSLDESKGFAKIEAAEPTLDARKPSLDASTGTGKGSESPKESKVNEMSLSESVASAGERKLSEVSLKESLKDEAVLLDTDTYLETDIKPQSPDLSQQESEKSEVIEVVLGKLIIDKEEVKTSVTETSKTASPEPTDVKLPSSDKKQLEEDSAIPDSRSPLPDEREGSVESEKRDSLKGVEVKSKSPSPEPKIDAKDETKSDSKPQEKSAVHTEEMKLTSLQSKSPSPTPSLSEKEGKHPAERETVSPSPSEKSTAGESIVDETDGNSSPHKVDEHALSPSDKKGSLKYGKLSPEISKSPSPPTVQDASFTEVDSKSPEPTSEKQEIVDDKIDSADVKPSCDSKSPEKSPFVEKKLNTEGISAPSKPSDESQSKKEESKSESASEGSGKDKDSDQSKSVAASEMNLDPKHEEKSEDMLGSIVAEIQSVIETAAESVALSSGGVLIEKTQADKSAISVASVLDEKADSKDTLDPHSKSPSPSEDAKKGDITSSSSIFESSKPGIITESKLDGEIVKSKAVIDSGSQEKPGSLSQGREESLISEIELSDEKADISTIKEQLCFATSSADSKHPLESAEPLDFGDTPIAKVTAKESTEENPDELTSATITKAEKSGKSPEGEPDISSVAGIKDELQTIKDDIKAKQDELSALINGRSVCEHKLEAKILQDESDIDTKKSDTTVTDILDTAERIVSSLNGKNTIADESDYIPSFSETKSFALTIEGKKGPADEITVETKSLEDSSSLQDQDSAITSDAKAETVSDKTTQELCSGLNGHAKANIVNEFGHKEDTKVDTHIPEVKSDEKPAQSAQDGSSKQCETSSNGGSSLNTAEIGSSIEGVGNALSKVISDTGASISEKVSAIGSLIPGDILKSSTSSDKGSITASPELSKKSDDVSSTKQDSTKGLELKLDSVKTEVSGVLESVVSQGSEKSGDISGASSRSGEKLTETTDKKSSLSSTQVEPPTDKDLPVLSGIAALKKEFSSRSETPASDILSDKDIETGQITPFSDRSSEQVSRAITHVWETVEGRPESRHYDSDEDIPGSPMSISSHIPSPPQFEYDAGRPQDPMMMSSFYGSLPGDFDDTKPGDFYDYGLHDRGSDGSLKKELGDKLSSIRSSITSTPESSPLPERRFDPLMTKEPSPAPLTSTQAPLPSVPAPATSAATTLATAPPLTATAPSLPPAPSAQPPTTSAPSASTLPGALPSSSAPSIPDPIGKWDKPLGLPPPHSTDSSTPYLRWNPYKEWGKPLGLPSPAPPPAREDTDVEVDTSGGSAKTTPKKVARMNAENNKYNSAKETSNKRRSESPVKKPLGKDRKPGPTPVYMDLSYVPHHGNSNYATVEFFKRVRARYYVFSGTEPSKEVFNALLEAKQSWEDKDLEVTIIPTYDTDTLGYWIAENEETLSKLKIDLSPSASRCTINLQDHDTSCSAYRLEF